MDVKEQLVGVLKTLEEAVQTHLDKERSRIKKLSDQIRESTENFSQVSAKNEALLSEITSATKELEDYKPMEIFKDLYTRGNAEANLGNAPPSAAESPPEQDDGFEEASDGFETDEERDADRAAVEAAKAKAAVEAAKAKAAVEAAAADYADRAAKEKAKADVANANTGQSNTENFRRAFSTPREARRYTNKKDKRGAKMEGKRAAEMEGKRADDGEHIETAPAVGGGRKRTRRRRRHSFRRK